MAQWAVSCQTSAAESEANPHLPPVPPLMDVSAVPSTTKDHTNLYYCGNTAQILHIIITTVIIDVGDSWWRGTVVERRSLASELSLSCARAAADG